MESAAQSFLVGNVGQLLSEEYQLLSGVGGEVIELRDDLFTMNALLRMQSEADEGAVDHFVREWMKQLRELAYDTEDCVDLYKLRIKSRPSDSVRAWLERLLGTLLPRRRLACQIRALRSRATAISERHARYYGVNRDALRRSTLFGPPVLAPSSSTLALRRASNPEHNQVVGIGEQADTLADQVKASVNQDRYLKVFSIVGFGGVGKTTLAMEVCRRLDAEFQRQAMVSVSQAFEPGKDVKPLLKRVLQQVVKDRTDNDRGIKEEGNLGGIDDLNDNQLAEKLNERLKDKRYLIVIDDVWTIRAWEAIRSVLPENNCDSRIIVTTRIDTVAKTCSPARVSGHYIHHMGPLKLEDSKKLFLSRAFGSMDASYPEELEDVMGDILRKCGGVPLAIVSIANVLASYTSSGSKEKWETVCKSIGSQMESNPTLEGMGHIVTLSYNHLPYELKSCMMYLSIFPEDYEINKDRLVSRWIAEGLVPKKRGLTLTEVAGSYIDELVSRNMIEPCFASDGKVDSCRVHDMLLEVMVSKALECNFASLLGGQYAGMSYDRIRRLSIHGGGEYDSRGGLGGKQQKKEKVGHGIDGMDVEHVRSLSMFQLEGHNSTKLLHYLLCKFTLLRVLDLEDCEGLTDGHMKYICRLYLLKFLSLKGTKISQVPAQVGELEHLQTFDVRHTNLKGLPETMIKLGQLERLEFNSKIAWYYKWKLPRGLKNMKALRRVDASHLENDLTVAQELSELHRLEDLFLCVECYDDEVQKELAQSLGKISTLRRLGLARMEGATLAFLYNLPTPPRLLQALLIEGELERGLPDWVGSLTHLVRFSIMHAGFHGDELFGVLCKLPNLKIISMMNGCYADEKIIAKTRHNFPVLSNLDVECNYGSSLPKHFVFEEGSMEKLKTLNMFFSDVERTISGLEHLTSLKAVKLTGKKGNHSLNCILGQLKDENSRNRQESNQIQVVVKYE